MQNKQNSSNNKKKDNRNHSLKIVKCIPKRTSDNIKYINERFKRIKDPVNKTHQKTSNMNLTKRKNQKEIKKDKKEMNKTSSKKFGLSSNNFKPFRNLSYERAKRNQSKEADNDLNKLDEKLNKIYLYFHQNEHQKSLLFESPKLINRIRSKRKLEEICNKIKVIV